MRVLLDCPSQNTSPRWFLVYEGGFLRTGFFLPKGRAAWISLTIREIELGLRLTGWRRQVNWFFGPIQHRPDLNKHTGWGR